MEKPYRIEDRSTNFATEEEAVEAAKRYAKKYALETATVYKAVAQVKTPTPDYEVVKL